MSGGSFNYLCTKEVGTLLVDGLDDVQRMAEELAELGYADDVAEDTQALIRSIQGTELALNLLIARLSPVWREMEWWQSGDVGEDNLKRALERYRER